MQDVKIDRDKYIGGSDIPIIMGISPFKTRFDLLLEKAQLKDDDFEGNIYTEYGNILEPQIREYINNSGIYAKPFIENKTIDNDLRYHADGFNGSCVLEIKTTSQIHENVDDYKVYLVQLLFGMQMNKVEKGLLAVYYRPSDFETDFNSKRLTTYAIDIHNYKELLEQINQAVEQFRIDLQKVKDNPLITEEELQPSEIIGLSNKVVELENQLVAYKELDTEYKKTKQELYNAMKKYNVKKWTTNSGVQITKVDATEDKVISIDKFNEEKFKEENEELYSKYIEKVEETKKGKAGYVRISLTKGD